MTPRLDLSQLKRRIATILAAEPPDAHGGEALLGFGVPAIDAALREAGIPAGAVHEVAGQGGDEEQGAAGAAFLALGLKANPRPGWVVWVTQDEDLYAPGLAALGLDLRRLILVCARRDAEVCWALEEALRSRALGAVVGEIGAVTLTATRRLQLAAEQAGIPCFLLRRWRTGELAAQHRAQPIAAATRWRITSLPREAKEIASELPCPVRRVDLWRCRNGRPRSWVMETSDDDQQRIAALPLALADALADRSTSPAPAPAQDRVAEIVPHRVLDRDPAAGPGDAGRQPSGDPGRRSVGR